MSNKNIAIPKYKKSSGQQIKIGNRAIVKEGSKLNSQYSSSSIVKDTNKNYKPNVISRHASEEQFRRKMPMHLNTMQDHHLTSAEQEYYPSLGHAKSAHDQIKLPNFYDYHNNRNYLKETSSTSSIQHTSNNRRVSPGNSPAFISSKPKLIIKDPRKGISKENFKIIKKIGEGKFGKVYLVRQITTGFMMAMKVQEKKKIINDNILEQFVRELKIQAFLNHPNIIDIYGFFHDDINFYTLQELGSDGQLYNMISQHRNLTQQATSFIVKNLLEAIHCMHDKKILHRDIKPENIVLIMGNVKLCDFGWAVNKIKKQELRSTFCGTPLYLSPQILKGYKYDEKVDLWAIGILAYQLLLGCSPFEINEHQDLYKILTDQVRFPKGVKVSTEFQEFIKYILNKNPKQRLPSNQLLVLPFIRKYQQFETCEQLCK